MQTRPIQLTDVTYNAATQCFEALVTVQDGEQLRRYACAIDAPITMSYRDAADGLSRQALRPAARLPADLLPPHLSRCGVPHTRDQCLPAKSLNTWPGPAMRCSGLFFACYPHE